MNEWCRFLNETEIKKPTHSLFPPFFLLPMDSPAAGASEPASYAERVLQQAQRRKDAFASLDEHVLLLGSGYTTLAKEKMDAEFKEGMQRLLQSTLAPSPSASTPTLFVCIFSVLKVAIVFKKE